MSFDSENIDDQVLLRYVLNDLPEAHAQVVEDWIEADVVHKDRFESLSKAWLHAGRNVDTTKFKAEQALKKVNDLIDNKTRVISIGIYWKVAAVVLLTLSAVLYAVLNRKEVEYITHKDKLTIAKLPDGSEVSLNTMSELSFDETILTGHRNVFLSGEAFFDVKSTGKPFVVFTHDAIIEVVGTAFNVSAYHDKPTSVVVQEGKVNVKYRFQPDQKILLASGEKTILTPEHALMKSVNDDMNYLAWKTGKIVFRDATFEQVIVTLKERLDLKIVAKNEKLLSCKITVTFNDSDIPTLIKVIEKTYGFEAYEENGYFIFDGEGC